MNGKTSTNLGKQQIKSLSELNQYNMEPTITDNRTVAKGRSSFLARCTVACFSLLAFLLIGSVQLTAQCEFSSIPDPLGTTLNFELDADCEADATNPGAVSPVYGVLGGPTCNSLIWYNTNNPADIRGGDATTSGLFTGADIGLGQQFWIAVTNNHNNDPAERSDLAPIIIDVVDIAPPTLNITGSPATIQCADLTSDNPTADELAVLALIAGLDLGADDNCGLADTTYMITGVLSPCDGSGIVRVYTVSVVVTDESGNASTAGEFVVEVEDQLSTPEATIANNNETINCEDPVPAPDWVMAFEAGACVFADTDDITIATDGAAVSTQNPVVLECGHYNYTITQSYILTYTCNGNTQNIDYVVNVVDNEAPLLDGDFLEDAVTFAVNYAENDVDGDNLAITARANNFDDVPSCVGCLEIELATANFITDNCASFQTLEILYQVTENGVTVIGDPAPVEFKAAGAAAPTVLDRCYPIGTSTVAFTIVDACLNAEEYIITIDVLDLDGPIVDCTQENIVQTPNPGECSSIAQWTPPTAEDCSEITDTTLVIVNSNFGVLDIPVLGPLGNGDMFADFPIGVNTVTYTFIDEFGNESSCAFTVTINEPDPIVDVSGNGEFTVPMCSTEVEVIFSGNLIDCTIDSTTPNAVILAAITVSGANLTPTYALTHDGFAYFEATGNLAPGTYLVFVTYKGVSVDHLVTVNTTPDNVAPAATACADDITVYNLDDASCEADVTVTVPTFEDNCDGPVVPVGVRSDGLALGDPYPVGVTTITWTATDAAGNEGICINSVIVLDQEAPQMEQLADITVNLSDLNPDGCNANVTWTEPVVADCSDFTVVSTNSSGDLFGQGTSIVTYTAFDEFGNSSVMSFDVTVVDDVDPEIACQLSPYVIQSVCDSILLPDLTVLTTASDNCNGVLTYTQNPPAGTLLIDVFGPGNVFDGATTTIEITVEDASENTASCLVTIVLQDLGLPVPALAELDSVTPYTVPDNVLPTASCGSVAIPAPEAFDCQGNVIYGVPPSFPNVVFVPGTPPVYIFPAQNDYDGFDSTYYAVQWTYTNPVSGLSSSQLQIVIVTSDVEPPVLTAPASIVVGTNADEWDDYNCSTWLGAGDAWDTDGNVVDISMNHGTFPNLLPIPIPAEGFVNDNCEVDSMWYVMTTPSGAVIQTGTNGDFLDAGAQIFDELGVYTITYYAMDGSGNIGQSTPFTVELIDDELPLETSCPDDIAYAVSEDGCTYTITEADLADVTATYIDNCELETVFWTVEPQGDGSVSQASGTGNLLGVVFDISGTPNGTDDFLVTFWSVDAAGNRSATPDCEFTITVNDETDPIIVCADDATRAANDVTVGDGLACVYVAEGGEFDPVVATDNCDVSSVTHDYMDAPSMTTLDGAIFPLDPGADSENPSVYTVTWTIVDNAGNESTCEIEITIVDESDPVWDYVWNINGLTCGETLDLYVTDTDCEVFFEWMRPGNVNVDDCTEFSITENITESIANFNAQFNVNQVYGVYDQNNPNLVSVNLPHGLTTFTYVATDAFGNTAVCEFYVNVIDNVPPVVTCPSGAAITSICDTFAIPTYNFAAVEDNCPLTITQNPAPGTTLGQIAAAQNIQLVPGAMFEVTLTATDPQGNSASCSFMVTLSDTEFPVPSVGVAGGFLDPVTPETFAGASCSSIILEAPVSTTCDQTIYGVPSQSNGLVPDSDPPAYYFNSATFAPGVQITWTYTNTQNGNAVQQLQFIQVIDDEVEPTVNVFFDGFADGGFTLGTSDDGLGDCEVNPSDAGRDWTVTANANQYAFDVPDPVTGEAIDNCGVVALWFTVDFADGTDYTSLTNMVSVNPADLIYPLGTSTVTVYAEDAAGNVGSASFTVTVVDDEDPIIACPANLTRAVNASGCSYTVGVNDITVSATDNCTEGGALVYEWFISTGVPGATATPDEGTGNSLEGVVFDISGTEGGAASFSVVYFVEDEAGNFDFCIFNVLVEDLTPPTIECAADATVGLDDEFTCGHTVEGTDFDPVVDDNCGVASVVNDYTGTNTLDGAFFPLLDMSGSTSYDVVWTVTDNFGNSATCTMVITVNDDQNPVWTGYDPQDVTLFTNQTDCEALYVWNRPTVSDVFECSDFSIAEDINNANVFHNVNSTFGVYDDEMGGQVIALFPVGQTVVSYTATDVNGNATTVSFTVTVIDNIPPTIVCEGPQMIPSICPDVQVPDYTGLGTVNDNCSNYTVTQSPAPGTLLSNLGVNLVNGATFNVTLTVTDDNNGLTDDCSFTVTLLNNDAPVPTVEVLPTINPTNTLAAGCAPFELPRPTATTCFSGTVVGVTTVTSPNVLTETSIIFNLPGTYVLVWSYIDGVNVSQQTQVVTVSADVIAPSVVCPDDFEVNNDAGECSALVDLNLLVGVELTATNQAEYDDQVDALLPGQFIDNCGATYSYEVNDETYAAGSDPVELAVGTHVVTYTVTDGEGNATSCEMTVTVNDVEAPVFADCPENNISVGQETIDPIALNTQAVGSPTNFAANPTYTFTVPESASGDYQLTVYADGEVFPGSAWRSDFRVQILSPDGVNVTQGAPGGAFNEWRPSALNSAGTFTGSHNFGTISNPAGEWSALVRISWNSGPNVIADVDLTFEFTPIEEPIMVAAVVNTDMGQCYATAEVFAPSENDNCEVTSYDVVITNGETTVYNGSVADLPADGIQWPIGLNEVVFTATDEAGNSSTCAYTVLVVDEEKPEIACPADIVVGNDEGECGAIVTYDVPLGTDNCPDSETVLEEGLESGALFPVGITTVTYLVTDASGNTNTCSFTVTVIDEEAPVFDYVNCGQTIQTNNLEGDCFNNVQWVRPAFSNLSDNCDDASELTITEEISNPTVLIVPPFNGLTVNGELAFAAFPVGITTITYTATDAAGNSAVCVVSIEVVDTEVPTITCPGSYTFPSVCPDESFVDLTSIVSVDDNCDNYTVTQSPGDDMTLSQILGGASNVEVGASFDVTFTVTDSYGNSATCVTTVTLQNIQSPIPTVGVDGGVLPALTPTTDIATTCSPYLVHAPTATANCGADIIIGTLSAGGAGVTPIGDFPFQSYWFEPGNYTITWVYNDGNINTPNASQVQVIQVTNDNVAPKVTCPANVVVSAEEGLCSYTGVMNIGLTAMSFANLPAYNAFTPASGQYADNCGATVQYSLSGATTLALTNGTNAGVQTFNVGVTTVTYVVTDAAGNSVSCSFTVTVTDDEAPMFAACPIVEPEPEPESFSVTISTAALGFPNTFAANPTYAFTVPASIMGDYNLTVSADGEVFGGSWRNEYRVQIFSPSGVNITQGAPGGLADEWAPSGEAFGGPLVGMHNFGTFVDPAGDWTVFVRLSFNEGPQINANVDLTFDFTPAEEAPELGGGNGTICAEAIELPSGPSMVNGSTTGNPLSGLPTCGTTLNSAAASWYVLEGVVGEVVINTFGSPFDTKLGVFSGSCGNLTCVTGNDDFGGLQSQVTFNAVEGTTYYVIVTGFSTAAGNYTLTTQATASGPVIPEADIVVNTDPGQCYATAPVEVLDVTDNCSVVSFTVVVENNESGVVYSGNVSNLPASLQWPLGFNNVTFTATDAAGNSATCGYSVAVIDEEAPVIACPELEELEIGPSFEATVESANPIPPAGAYNIFYPIEVPASLTGLYNVTVSYNGTSGAFSWMGEYVSAIIGPDGEVYFNAQPTPMGGTGPIVGTYSLGLVANPGGTWEVGAADLFGDFTFDVDVTLSFEPVAFPDALAVLNTNDDGFGDCSTSYTWNHPAASDNCDFEYTVSYFNPDGSTEGPFVVMAGASATRVFDQGTTAVIYTATDISGNSTTCEFSIVVVDNEPPTAICDPISITLNPEGIAIVTPSVIENNINDGSYDNCPGQLTYWLDQVLFTCADLGINPIRLYVMDATGNISICNTTITVLDNNLAANPVWPADVTITNCQNPQNLSLTGMVTGDSPCGNAGTYVDVIIPGNCPGNYVIQRNWTVLDAAGIPTTHTQIITVVDNQGPIISGVPSNITLTSCEGLAALIATPGNVQAVDCPGDSETLAITYSTAISACSAGSYTITRTWLATDACGNSSTATQVITVLDNQAPVFTGPTEITLNVSDYDVTTCVSSVDLMVTVTDCNLAGPTVVTNSFNAGGANASDIYPVGTTTVVFTATDACGNSSTHTTVVTVVDDVNPVAICLESFNVVLNNQGVGTIFPWELDNGSYDNCENITMFLNEVGMTSLTFTCDDLGPQAVTLVVQDDAGNLNECVTIVNVMANSADQLEVTVVTTDVTAVGGNDGTATAVVTGGSGNYAYWWSNGETTQTITGLTAGVYSVTVSDLNPANCATAEGSGEVMGGAPITFHVGSAAGAVGDIVEVPVSIENFANILGFQFTIDVVDPSIGQIVGFNNFGLPGLTAADFNPATGTVSWVNNLPQAVTLADGTVIFHIQVQLVGGMTGSSSDVVITSDPLALEVIQEQGGLAVQIPAADVVTTDGEVVVTQGLSGPFAIGGNIITEDGLPVALVDVDMTGDVMELMTTTTNGMYFFDDIPLGSDVSVTPSKDVNHLNGVTTFDAVLLQRHLIGTQILGSPYKKIAADIDADGMLTVGDLIQLRRVILLIDNDFINPFTGLKNNTSWRFALPGLTDPAPASMIVPAYTEVRDYMNLSADYIADHYIGVKIGDLNNSVSPNALAPETGDNAHPANYRSTLAMVVNDIDYRAGETFTVDFLAKDFVDVAGYQFTFNFDAAQLNFAGVEAGDLRNLSADNFGLTFVEEGAVTVSWNDIDADLQNDAVLFSLTFEAIANGTLSNAIEITSELIRVEGYRSNGEFIDITIQYTGGISARGEFILYQNEPNPFVSETRIGFELPEAANGTLSIFDGTGRLLRSYPGEFVQGYNEISVERGDLPVSGVLYYQLSTPTHSATKKMILAQ